MVVSWANRPAGSETRELRIPRGVVVVRYLKSGARHRPPSIILTTPTGCDAELVGLAFHARQVLAKPGNAVAVVAKRDTVISLEVVPAEGDGSRDAEIAVERITAQLPQDRPAASTPAAPFPTEALADFQVLAHVARHGDIVAANGEWICGPRLPMSIEGVEIQTGRLAAGLDLLVSGEARLRRPLTFPAAAAGSFVGTRGRATPLTSLTFSLIGRWAPQCQLAVDALFLGSAMTTRIGNSIELSGPTGTEPLVGLRLALQPIQQAASRLPSIRPAAAIAPAPAPEFASTSGAMLKRVANGSAGRVRVFRASAQGV